MKKRVMVMSEAHFLSSGFGTYSKELLTRLHKTGKYEIAEFASYGKPNAPKVPWLYYPNAPADSDQAALNEYNSNPTFQFGSWRFDIACLDFKPDIVLCYRDPWMDNWIEQSPLRPYFHWVWMPTVDSAPQKQEWIETFSGCDAVLAYSEYGGEVLLNQGKERINYIGCASPGINPDIYKPVPKHQHRIDLNIDPNCFIIGTVMRNQKRKLFFELMKSFKLFLNNTTNEIASKSFLYLHTSYPEKMGWDISRGIMENGLAGKVLMTYICKVCGRFFPNMFQDALCKCKHCGNLSAVCPTVGLGLTVEDLAKIYNLFDLYAQYAICEGFGMPQVEAAACGVPVVATNYSAMRDVVKFTNGYPVPVKTFFRELETDAERAYPDNEVCAEIFNNFFHQTEEQRLAKSMQVRQSTITKYSWDKTAKVWEEYIDTYTPTDLQGQWNAPLRLLPIPDKIDAKIESHHDFVRWIFHLLQKPEKVHQHEGQKILRDLVFGAEMGQGILQPINRDQVFEGIKHRITQMNQAEMIRTGQTSIQPDPFIIEAHEELRKNTE